MMDGLICCSAVATLASSSTHTHASHRWLQTTHREHNKALLDPSFTLQLSRFVVGFSFRFFFFQLGVFCNLFTRKKQKRRVCNGREEDVGGGAPVSAAFAQLRSTKKEKRNVAVASYFYGLLLGLVVPFSLFLPRYVLRLPAWKRESCSTTASGGVLRTAIGVGNSDGGPKKTYPRVFVCRHKQR